MKKFFTLFTFILLTVGAWAECTDNLVSNTQTLGVNKHKDHYFKQGVQVGKVDFEASRSNASGIGNLQVYEIYSDGSISSNPIWSTNPGSVDWKLNVSFVSYSANVSSNAVGLRFNAPLGCSYSKYYKNVVVTYTPYLNVDQTSLNFGNLKVGESSSKTVKVTYSIASGKVSSSNSAFTVSTTSVGSTTCGKYGTETVTVTFNPSSVGAQSGTITIGSKTISVSGAGTLPNPTSLTATPDYTSVALNWPAVSGATSYVVTCGNQSKEVASTSYTFTGLTQGASYNCSVKAKANGTESAAATASATTKALETPSISASNITYSSAILNWNAIADAKGGYDLIIDNGNAISLGADATSYQVSELALHSNHTVQIYSKLEDGTRCLLANSTQFTTNDLAASSSFTVSDASYTSVQGSWAKIADATGYKVVASNGAETIFHGADVTSGAITGIMPNGTYTFTVYGMYNDEVSLNGNTSGSIKTLTTNCTPSTLSVKHLGTTGLAPGNWDDKSDEVDVNRNQATMSFSYSVTTGLASSVEYRIDELVNGTWFNSIWKSTKSSGSASVQLRRGATKVRFTYSGNYGADFTNVTLVQGSYLEATPTTLDFGTVKVGQSVDAKTVSVAFSTMKGDVTSSSDAFTASKDMVGADNCDHGVETFDVTVNTAVQPGEYTSDIMVGSQKVPAKVTIEALKAPLFNASATGKSVINVNWEKVDGATSYKLVCEAAGINEEIAASSEKIYNYNASGLSENTEYEFTITTMFNDIANESATVKARTYSTVTIEKAGEFVETTVFELVGQDGKWNKDEYSFAYGSAATVDASNSNPDAKFEKIVINGVEFTTIPQTFNIGGPTTATIYYAADGVAKTEDGKVFPTLEDAVKHAKETGSNPEVTLLADRLDENLILTKGTKVTIDGKGHKIGDVLVEDEAKLTVSGTLIVGDLNIKTAYRTSGEVDPLEDNLEVTGKVSFDKILDPSGKINSKMYYGFCVPFNVNVNDMYAVNGSTETKLQYEENYYVYEYDGAMRASTGKGWVTLGSNATLVPGKMYLMASRYDNVIRFYKSENSPVVSALTTISLQEFASSNVLNQGWNAIGNSQIYHVNVESETMYGQVLKNGSNAYEVVKISDESFVVAAPLFIQYVSGSKDVDLTRKSNISLRSVSAENSIFNVRISANGATEYADQLFLSASDMASDDYVIGKDLAKMGSVTGVDVARIWLNAKSTKLAVLDAKLDNGSAVIPMGVSAPKAGNYNIYLNKSADGLKLELLHNGQVLHNFADGEYNLALSSGENSGYSLKVSVDGDAPIATEAAEVDGISAYINNGVLYINGLNEGAEYYICNAAGKIARGESNCATVSVVLPTKGLCIVASGNTTIKLLNK